MLKYPLNPVFSHSRNFANARQLNYPLILDNAGNKMNPIAQFDIDNTKLGHSEILLRIGSVVGVNGGNERFDLIKGASDKAAMEDQFGAQVPKIQGFSELSSHMPISISEIHIFTSDKPQQNRPFTHNKLYMTDAVVEQRTSNIAFTQEKTDRKNYLNVAKGNWTLSANQYFSYTISDNIKLTLLFRLNSIGNIANFIAMQNH